MADAWRQADVTGDTWRHSFRPYYGSDGGLFKMRKHFIWKIRNSIPRRSLVNIPMYIGMKGQGSGLLEFSKFIELSHRKYLQGRGFPRSLGCRINAASKGMRDNKQSSLFVQPPASTESR